MIKREVDLAKKQLIIYIYIYKTRLIQFKNSFIFIESNYKNQTCYIYKQSLFVAIIIIIALEVIYHHGVITNNSNENPRPKFMSF